MKKSELMFSFLLVPLDFLMIILAGTSAYYIRYADFFQKLRPVIFNLHFGGYFKIVLAVAVLWIVIFALSGLYAIRGDKRFVREVYKVVSACSTGLMAIVILIFIRRELFDSRFIVLAAWILSIIYISFSRGLVRLAQNYLHNFGIGVHKVILVGNTKSTDTLIKEFSRSRYSAYKVAKRIRDFTMETAQELAEFLKLNKIDEIIQSDPNLSKAEVLRLYDFADENHLAFKYAADLLGAKVLKTEVIEIAGLPIVKVKKTPLDGWGRIIKRIFDVVFSLLFIIIFSPFIMLFAILIKIDSKGPILYFNERVGQAGNLFKLYKFRSMLIKYCTGDEYASKEAEEYERDLISQQNSKDGPVYKIANDPRITRVGKFIRRWSIDEMPQFFNVLMGHMSLVGPRPHQPREVAKYEFHHKKVLSIKPGVTGMAQVSGRSDLSFEEEIKLDTYYIENWSLLLDLSIILRTPLAIIKPRKVE